MIAECQFATYKKGSKCRACGYELRCDYPLPLSRNCPGGPCVHLGRETGESVIVACVDCKGRSRDVAYEKYFCAVFGECLPTYRCTKDAISESMSDHIAVCRGCDKFSCQSRIIKATD